MTWSATLITFLITLFAAAATTLIAFSPAAPPQINHSTTLPQTNHPPTVKIESPANNTVLTLNTPVTYQVQVTDQEDGDSRYDEINTKEVILELTRFKPGAKILPTGANPAIPSSSNPAPNSATFPSPTEPSALDIMATNYCFNCHQFNAKSLGPSFFEIARRYPLSHANSPPIPNSPPPPSTPWSAGSSNPRPVPTAPGSSAPPASSISPPTNPAPTFSPPLTPTTVRKINHRHA